MGPRPRPRRHLVSLLMSLDLMDALLGFLGPIFWGLLLLSVLVFVHEGGHFLAARACGVRVLEFFLGMPCRFNIHHVSKRIGTKFGVTPILLGGYAEICGMDPTEVPSAPEVLACIHRHGTVDLDVVSEELGLALDEVQDACSLLYGWGSIVPVPDDAEREQGEEDSQSGFPRAFAAVPRDPKGHTVYDGRAFDRAQATAEGEPWVPPMSDEEFFELERSHTYVGKGFWARAFMLVAGIAVNILTGFLLVIAVYSALGVSTPIDANVLGEIVADSPAEQAGLRQGDRVLAVNGERVDSWLGMLDAFDATDHEGAVELDVWRPNDIDAAFDRLPFDDYAESDSWARENGAFLTIEVSFDEDGMIGINVPTQVVRLNPLQSCQIAVDNIVATAQSVGSLLNPRHTMEVLDNSTSVVGISVMSAQAAAEGAATFLNFAALISFSLGFMNLLPIPPLDGGKLVIEAVQAVTRRKVPVKAQTIISMVGIGLFGLLFIYMLGSDIIRFF